MTRIAHCCCGALRAEVTGEPPRVAICHCMECQRRTGSAFGLVIFFPKEQVRTEGPSKVYLRCSDAGRKVEFHFCPIAAPRCSGTRSSARSRRHLSSAQRIGDFNRPRPLPPTTHSAEPKMQTTTLQLAR